MSGENTIVVADFGVGTRACGMQYVSLVGARVDVELTRCRFNRTFGVILTF